MYLEEILEDMEDDDAVALLCCCCNCWAARSRRANLKAARSALVTLGMVGVEMEKCILGNARLDVWDGSIIFLVHTVAADR